MSLRNTHNYDGKLKERLERYRLQLQDIHQLDTETKVRKIITLKKQLENPKAVKGLNLIVSSTHKNKSSNYDPSNDLIADDVLCLILDFMGEPGTEVYQDVFPVLEEQLVDILNGACAQGRTTRIFQAFVTFAESLEDKEKKETKTED
jgi:hypothetical protein